MSQTCIRPSCDRAAPEIAFALCGLCSFSVRHETRLAILTATSEAELDAALAQADLDVQRVPVLLQEQQ